MTAMVRPTYDRLRNIPFGHWIFSRLIGYMAPYSASVRPQVVELRDGYAKVQMRDRRSVRNPFQSVHAIAILNLAELAGGLAFVYSLPKNARGIVTGLEIDYLKKGRGTLTAECSCEPVRSNDNNNYLLNIDVSNEAGEVVAKVRAKWIVSPVSA